MRVSKGELLVCAAAAFSWGACSGFAAQEFTPKDPMSAMGLSYKLPPGWAAVETKQSSPVVKTQPPQAPVTEEQRKGTACIEAGLTARHGEPASTLVVVLLPFKCFGQRLNGNDLAGFGAGAAEGLKEAFDIAEPVYGAYTLGSHRIWIERARGNPKGHAAIRYTVEIACGLLKKGAACWMTTAADEDSLKAFEQAPVKLDEEDAVPLVPANAFDAKPS